MSQTEWLLYYRKGTCGLASYIALEEAGATYRIIDVVNQQEKLLAVNPRGRVPALLVDGRTLVETVAILTLIARRFPRAGLLPDDETELAECYSTMSWFTSTLHINYRRFFKPAVYTNVEAAHASIRDKGRQDYLNDLEELNTQLTGRDWLHGDRLSMADFYGLVFVSWALTSELYDNRWTAITAWARKLVQRGSVRRVLDATQDSLLRLA